MTRHMRLKEGPTLLTASQMRGVVQRKCTRCEGGSNCLAHAKATTADRHAPPAVHAVLRASGHPLEAATRHAMEIGFDRDFSQVRVHSDARAAASAASVGADAYTVGRDIAFGPGRYAPATAAGRRLLAHELAHVIQQGASSPLGQLELGHPDTTAEAEADAAARAVAEGRPVAVTGSSPAVLQRQPAPTPPVAPPAPARPTVSLTNFRNSGNTHAENTCAMCPTALGVPATDGTNRMELRGDISGHVASAQYDIKRTKERGTWKLVGTTWTQQSHVGPGADDDSHNDDEMLAPINSHVYVIDTPGWAGAITNPTGDTAATEAVYKASFTETCNVKVGTGVWANSSNSVDWHSTTWLEKAPSGWRRKAGSSEIALGAITIGTGAP